MTPKELDRASLLYDRLKKMDVFLKSYPTNADSITYTLRAGKKTKSFSISGIDLIDAFLNDFNMLRDKTIQELKDLNVEL